MRRYHAAWVLPIASAPQRDGWVAVDDAGRIAATGQQLPPDAADERDLGAVALLPGVVNAHTHLELSYLRDAVPPASEFVTWIRAVMSARRTRADANSAEIVESIDRGIDEAVRCGTALVGDISNTLVPVAPLVRSALAGVVFFELLKFNPPDAAALVEQAVAQIEALTAGSDVRVSLAAHAPYSVAPAVFRALRLAMDRDARLSPCSVHLSESAAEVEFIATGGGPWRALLDDVGAWDPTWTAPGVSPVQYLEETGFLDARVLAVHGVQMTRGDLHRLAASGATLVTCPRSNGHTGAGAPPLDQFYASGVPIAIGTDSLASSADLNVFAELATMRALAPSVPASALLDSATRQGARCLGFAAEFGTLEPGRRGRFLAVQIPPHTDDVEEYLVSGVSPEQIAWIE
jgi:cytosine/adenosine deaminase-related metal-dependent hydrolase